MSTNQTNQEGNKKIVSIHQPGYIPWLGFFKKILYSDVFVFLDDAKYVPKDWHSRNKIRTSQGDSLLSIPIKKNSGENINEVKIFNESNWSRIHKKTIKIAYQKAEFFNEYWDEFSSIYDKKFERLLDLNLEIIYFILKKLDIQTKTLLSSDMKIVERGSDRNLKICEVLDADVYLSGSHGVNYLKEEDFTKKNITVEYQNFQHPVYRQPYQPFIPNMGAIDLLFNEGENSINILKEAKNF